MAVFYASEGDLIVPADAWFWCLGNEWKAVVAANHIEDWWDGVPDSERVGQPIPWTRQIHDLPLSGGLHFYLADGTEMRLPDTHPLPLPSTPYGDEIVLASGEINNNWHALLLLRRKPPHYRLVEVSANGAESGSTTYENITPAAAAWAEYGFWSGA